MGFGSDGRSRHITWRQYRVNDLDTTLVVNLGVYELGWDSWRLLLVHFHLCRDCFWAHKHVTGIVSV